MRAQTRPAGPAAAAGGRHRAGRAADRRRPTSSAARRSGASGPRARTRCCWARCWWRLLGLMQLWVTVADAVHDRYAAHPARGAVLRHPGRGGRDAGPLRPRGGAGAVLRARLLVPRGRDAGQLAAFGIFTLVGSLVAADRITARQGPRRHLQGRRRSPASVNLLRGALPRRSRRARASAARRWSPALFAFVGTALAVPVMVMALTPLIEATLRLRLGHQAAGAGEPEPPGAQGADRPGAGHVPPLASSSARWWRTRRRRSARTRCSRASCAYYHDIGKGRNPLYFGENQKGENRHDPLAPAMSAVIIKRHVTEGWRWRGSTGCPSWWRTPSRSTTARGWWATSSTRRSKEQEGKENAPADRREHLPLPGPQAAVPRGGAGDDRGRGGGLDAARCPSPPRPSCRRRCRRSST